MRKIIWGIGIVFCIQIAFQLAMTADRTDASYAALHSPLQTGIANPASTLSDEDLDTNIAPVESETALEASPVQTRYLIRYIRVPEPPPAAERPTAAAAIKPVVITYDRTGALTTASTTTTERRTPARTETPSDDTRSLIAKVVTKPYDWLKAVGSKLH